MPFIAAIVLFWQRRRLVPLLRRFWASLRPHGTGAPAGARGSVNAVGRRALVGAWRAVDTEANATRVARFVTWMRSFAAGGEVVRAASTPETGV